PEKSTDSGFLGDGVGNCPLCNKEVRRTKFGYGCSGYKEGCKFSVNAVICGRAISMNNMKNLLKTGKTYKIEGFVSPKSGKTFDAFLKLDENKKVVFEF
ncbi:MAG: topoisomerase C-terminal repeat-containing protein, partial [Bacillota bacterium]|nr:topoisomerase C-terminal repeat-containing protein [Bacillota bacterium]